MGWFQPDGVGTATGTVPELAPFPASEQQLAPACWHSYNEPVMSRIHN